VLVQVRRKTSEPTSAPKATGLPIADAVNALGRLYVLELVPVGGPPAERGRIVEQTPALGQPIALRGTLTLKFVPDPTLPATVSAPSVAGLSTSQAIDAMSAAGLQARVVETSVPGAPVDLCVGQVPLPGTELPRDGRGWLVVTVAVPDAPPPPTGGSG
jgi:beta-lactam-binding protein with PASTA domain